MGLAAQLTPPSDWAFAVPDWEQRLGEGRSLMPDLPLDEVAVARAVGIFNKLRLPDVAGHPALREAAGDWLREIVAALFGSVDVTGYRWVREPFILVPKKNSKTTGGAAIMLTALIYDRDPNQAFYLYGPTQEIADRGFQQAMGMIEIDPTLKAMMHVQPHLKVIKNRRTGSTLKVQTFDEKVATGSIPKGQMIDEWHLLGKKPGAGRLIGQLRGNMITRSDAFMVGITTQSDEPPAGVFRTQLQFARAVRDGKITGAAATVLPILYEFPEAMQTDKSRPWANPDNWPMVLPNLGRSLRLETLKAEWAKAQEMGEDEIRRWASQHLNVEIGLALHSDRWRGADYWENAADPSLTLDALIERSEVVVVGVDGGGLDDLFGLCVAGRCKVTRDWLFWAHAWAQRSVLDERKEIADRLRDFEADGDLTFCEDATQDIAEIAALVRRLADAGLLPEQSGVGVDPQGISALLEELAREGIGDAQVVGISQGFRLSSAVWGMERKLKDGTLWHSGSRMMDWCVGNAKAEQKGNAVLITKQVAGKAKIDPLVAAFNAVKLLERNPTAAEPADSGMVML